MLFRLLVDDVLALPLLPGFNVLSNGESGTYGVTGVVQMGEVSGDGGEQGDGLSISGTKEPPFAKHSSGDKVESLVEYGV